MWVRVGSQASTGVSEFTGLRSSDSRLPEAGATPAGVAAPPAARCLTTLVRLVTAQARPRRRARAPGGPCLAERARAEVPGHVFSRQSCRVRREDARHAPALGHLLLGKVQAGKLDPHALAGTGERDLDRPGADALGDGDVGVRHTLELAQHEDRAL